MYWRSKRQSVVAQSSKGAELTAMSLCIRDLLWLRKFYVIPRKALRTNKVKKLLNSRGQ